jgi:pimeloyl-ACP methyl ester carboxylesterase
MTKTTTGYADLGDAKLYYEIAGEGDALVLSHAGFVDSGMWDDQLDAFAQRYRVIRYDMRGYGKSGLATAPVARRQDLYRLLQYLGVKRTHLLGCSMSGKIIIDFALEYPEMVSSLIPVSAVPSGFQMQGEPPRYLLEMIEAVKQNDLARASDLQIRIWVDGSFREPEQVDPRVRKHAEQMNKIVVENGTWAMDAQPVDPLNPPAVERLQELAMPTLIIDGALDHPEILRAADLMEAEIKGAQKVVIPDTAHVPNMEKPAEFNRAVLDFLQSVD